MRKGRAPSALAGQRLDGPDASPQRIDLAIAEAFEDGDGHQERQVAPLACTVAIVTSLSRTARSVTATPNSTETAIIMPKYFQLR